MDYTVAIQPLDSYDDYDKSKEAVEKLLDSVNGLDFIKPGIKVAVKVNLVSAMDPKAAATTHPKLVKSLCELLISKGADVTVGDSPGGPFTGVYLNHVYSATKTDSVKEVGAKVNKNYNSTKCDNFSEAKVLHNFEYTAWLDDADVIINFAKLKTHGMMCLSCAVKNLFGTIPGTVKPEYHYRFPNTKDFADMLIDLNEYFKPVLNIVDAVEGMEGNGPTMGTPRHIGAILASKSSYALDRICAQLIGLDENNVPTLAEAKERNLCPDINEINVIGDINSFIVPNYNNVERPNNIEFLSDLLGLKGKVFGKIIKFCMSTRPKVNKSKCVSCRKCHDICPAKAITMVNDKPQINRDVCIRCFCCQEFCPKGAIKVHRPIVAKFLNKI